MEQDGQAAAPPAGTSGPPGRTTTKMTSSTSTRLLGAALLMALTLHRWRSSSAWMQSDMLWPGYNNETGSGGDLGAEFAPTYVPPMEAWDVDAIHHMCAKKLGFKVYVYALDQRELATPFLTALGSSYEKMRKVRTHVADYMQSWPAALEELWRTEGLVTDDPEEADAFYIPTHSMDLWRVGMDGSEDDIERVLAEYVESVIRAASEQHPYWNRYGGARHVLMEPNDRGRCLYTTTHAKELLRNATMLHTNGNQAAHAVACMMGVGHDIIVPPRSVLGGGGAKRGSVHNASSWDRLFGAHRSTKHRATLSDSIHLGGNSSRASRQYLYRHLPGIPGLDYREIKRKKDYVKTLSASDFSLHMSGNVLWGPRLVDSMAHGALPIIIGDYSVLPYDWFIPYDEFVVHVGWNQLQFLPEIIGGISTKRRLAMRTVMRQYVPLLLYSDKAHLATYASLCLKEKVLSVHNELFPGQRNG